MFRKKRTAPNVSPCQWTENQYEDYLSNLYGMKYIIGFTEISYEDMRIAENINPDSDLTDLPDWQKETVLLALDVIMQEGTGQYIQIPTKWQINEYRIMEKFCGTISSGRMQTILYETIRGKGAFRKFKNAVCRLNLETAWYKYYEEELRKIALVWCEDNQIEFDE